MKSFAKHFGELTTEFRDLLPKLRQDLKKKDVHRVRTLNRKLRSALWILQHGSQMHLHSDLKKDLKRFGRLLGERRRLDVMLKDAKKYKLSTGKLRKARREAGQNLKTYLSKKQRQKIITELDLVLEVLPRASLDSAQVLTLLKQKISDWESRTVRQPEELHKFRIQMKKVRDRMELLNRPTTTLGEVQDCLGKAHDLTELEAWYAQKASHKLQQDEAKTHLAAANLVKPSVMLLMKKLR